MEVNRCKICGNVLGIGAVKCYYCGTRVSTVKKASFGWAVLGFLFPFVGLILFVALFNSDRSKAKKAGIGALFGFIITTFLLNFISITVK